MLVLMLMLMLLVLVLVLVLMLDLKLVSSILMLLLLVVIITCIILPRTRALVAQVEQQDHYSVYMGEVCVCVKICRVLCFIFMSLFFHY